jgi:hypothetical protein
MSCSIRYVNELINESLMKNQSCINNIKKNKMETNVFVIVT